MNGGHVPHIKPAGKGVVMGLGALLLALWTGFAPGGGAALGKELVPVAKPQISLTKAAAKQKGSDGNWEFAATKRPWGPAGLPAWCAAGVMDKMAWSSKQTGFEINQSSANMFFVTHEVGHCMDGRAWAEDRQSFIRREAFADAFAACILKKEGRGDDMDLIAHAREDELDPRLGKKLKATIARAMSKPQCQAVAGSAREDFLDAWAVAAQVDVEIFGADGASAGPSAGEAALVK